MRGAIPPLPMRLHDVVIKQTKIWFGRDGQFLRTSVPDSLACRLTYAGSVCAVVA
jgi:hypothetical protein